MGSAVLCFVSGWVRVVTVQRAVQLGYGTESVRSWVRPAEEPVSVLEIGAPPGTSC